MSALGSVKNRLKTMFIINKNKKFKLERKQKIVTDKKQTIFIKAENIKKIPSVTLRKINIKKIEFSNNISKKSGIPRKIENNSKIQKFDNSLFINNKYKQNNVMHNDSKDIMRRFKFFIKNSKDEIKKVKSDLKVVEENIKKVKDEKNLEQYHHQLVLIKQRIDKLKRIYTNIIEKYEFIGFDEINDNLLDKYIDDFKFKYSIDDIDLLVDKCKSEINYVEEINELANKIEKLELKENIRKEKIDYLRNDYYNRSIDYNKLQCKNEIINRHILKENDYINNLVKEIDNNVIDTKITKKLIFDRDYISNLYKLSIGLSLFDKTFIGAFIGAFLIKSNLTPLLARAFKKEDVIKYSYRYTEYTKKIDDNICLIKQTHILLNDSIRDISILKDYMKSEYRDYLEAPDFKHLYKNITELEKDLIVKRNNNNILENKLLEQKNKSNEKQKKLEILYK